MEYKFKVGDLVKLKKNGKSIGEVVRLARLGPDRGKGYMVKYAWGTVTQYEEQLTRA